MNKLANQPTRNTPTCLSIYFNINTHNTYQHPHSLNIKASPNGRICR